MSFCCSSRFIVLKVLLVINLLPSFLTFICEAVPNYLYHKCPTIITYDTEGPYNSSLYHAIYDLSSNSATKKFYNTTSGNNAPDKVYGLFMCRGDATTQECNDCVIAATTNFGERCPLQKVAHIWYNDCMVRYDNKSIFSTLDISSGVSVVNTANITDIDIFTRILTTDLNNLATRASSNDQSTKGGVGLKGFARTDTFLTSNRSVYSWVQCTPDLSGDDCNTCLRVAIDNLPSCCTRKQGGRVFLPSCNIRYLRYTTTDTNLLGYESAIIFIEFVPPLPPPPLLPTLPPAPTSYVSPKGKGTISIQFIIVIVILLGVSVLLFILGIYFVRMREKQYRAKHETSGLDQNNISRAESLQYRLSIIEAATSNFSSENKLGEGGFGEVFKGTLPNGQMVAVKRLSRSSGQGALEFKNEVGVLAKLQHVNLVKLVGYCLEREEKILIYEFVPNKSLDYFLFDPEKQQSLDWSRRYTIIRGITRGILYLHEHSRLRIIHRDLKASNVLLDGDMNPKISDFGMAKIFGVDQSQANTNRIVGTFGYMAPEYAMHGEFSVKSDVFSFGVLLLEIISGRKSTSFYDSEGSENLLSHAWKHWKDDTPLELVDPTFRDNIVKEEVILCINIGLLCVQENANDRPTMSSVVHMLDSYTSITLRVPHQPAFFPRNRTEE